MAPISALKRPMNVSDRLERFSSAVVGLVSPLILLECPSIAAEQVDSGSVSPGIDIPGGNPAVLLLPTAAYIFYVGVQTAFPKFSRKGSANYITILYAMGLLYFGSLLVKQYL